MKLSRLFVTESIGCKFHAGLNIILGVNRGDDTSPENTVDDKTGSKDDDSSDLAEDENGASQGDPVEDRANDNEDSQQDTEKVSDTNGVGKTLLVSVIKHILGGDTETALSSNFFEQKKYWGNLEITVGGNHAVLSRPLWRPLADGLYLYSDGTLEEFHGQLEKAKVSLEETVSQRDLSVLLEQAKSPLRLLSKKEYQQHIAKMENIDYSKSNITLSSLLDFIIRDEKVGFSDPISRIRRAQWVQYRSAQYLFGLPATTEETCSKLQEEITALDVELKTMKDRLKSKDITGDDKVENLKLNAESRLKKVQDDIEELKVVPSLETAREEYQRIRTEFTELVTNLNKKEHYLKAYQKQKNDLQVKSKATAQLLKVGEFYEDLIQFFPEQLEENITEFQAFFHNLADDRLRYFTDLITELKADIKFLYARKEQIEPTMASIARQLKGSNLVRDIATLASSEEKIQNELRELEEFRKLLLQCENLEEKIEKLEELRRSALVMGKKQEKTLKDRRKRLISLFHEIVSEIYGAADGELAFEYNSNGSSSTAGRTEITCSIPSQSSHGRTYARINIFDFIWLLGEKSEDDFNPEFLIHDGSYSKISTEVKNKMLKAVDSRLNGRQYFITLNEGELDIKKEWTDFVCCRLDGSGISGKFFQEQFD